MRMNSLGMVFAVMAASARAEMQRLFDVTKNLRLKPQVKNHSRGKTYPFMSERQANRNLKRGYHSLLMPNGHVVMQQSK